MEKLMRMSTIVWADRAWAVMHLPVLLKDLSVISIAAAYAEGGQQPDQAFFR